MFLGLAIGVSSLILLGVFTILLIYVCWIKGRKKSANFYTITDLPTSRQHSSLEIISIHIDVNNAENSSEQRLSLDPNLMDSTDFSNKFTNSLLRINSKCDEMCSYASTSSLRTYYSTNYSRSNSKCTFVSCSEGSDNGNMV